MEEIDEFDLEDELERELEAEMALDEEDDEAPAAPPIGGASADVDSRPQPSGPGAADQQPSTAAAGETQPDSGAEERQTPTLDEEQQLEARKQERQRKNKEVMKLLTEEQLDRYESYRRSTISRPNMKKLLHSVTGQAPHQNTTIVMCGIAKLFVGDVVETARMVAAEMGDTGALRPVHLQAAYQRLDREGKIPHRAKKPRRMRML